MGNMTPEQLAALIANVVGQVLAGQTATPKASNKFLAKGERAAPSDPASKDAQTVARFKKRGFNVTLMDRDDPSKAYVAGAFFVSRLAACQVE